MVVAAQKFFAEVIAARREKPEDDIITDLVQAEFEDPVSGERRPLDMYELMDLLDQLLTGGNETTTNAIGSGLRVSGYVFSYCHTFVFFTRNAEPATRNY